MRILFFLIAFSLTAQSKAQKSQVIQTASEKDLIPEGIAVNAATGTIYISSIAKQKIIAVDSNGAVSDFVKTGDNGYLEGLGMKVEKEKNLLWTLSNKKEGRMHSSKLLAFDLQTGKLVKQFSSTDTAERLFNDLTIDASGTIYFTDTYYSALLKANRDSDKLEIVAEGKELSYPNGITTGKQGNIYVATYSKGIVRIDAATKKVHQLQGYTDTVMAHNLDGLMYWKNTLIGVYNVAKNNADNAIVQYKLNEAGDKIIEERIIDKGNLQFKEPTTIDIANGFLYVLANSHLAVYNANKESVKGVEQQLSPVVILKYKLQ